MKKYRGKGFSLFRSLMVKCLLAWAVLWIGGIAVFAFLPVPFSAVMAERQAGAWLHGDISYVAHSEWVSMDNISPWMALAVIAAEDQNSLSTGVLTLALFSRCSTTAAASGCVARQRFLSRPRKISFCGTDVAGYVKGWRRG